MEESVVAASVSALVSLVIGGVTLGVGWWRPRAEQRRERERVDEAIATQLVDRRIEPYAEFMSKLSTASRTTVDRMDEAACRARAAEVGALIHSAIYGNVGLLATHETREVLVRARARCAAAADGRAKHDAMVEALWDVHQMLRADLNLRQPRLAHAIERLRQANVPETTAAIEKLAGSIVHLRWTGFEHDGTGSGVEPAASAASRRWASRRSSGRSSHTATRTVDQEIRPPSPPASR